MSTASLLHALGTAIKKGDNIALHTDNIALHTCKGYTTVHILLLPC